MRRGLWITVAITVTAIATGVAALAHELACIDYDWQ